MYVACAYVTSEKTSTANEHEYITESVYVACVYITSEKTSAINEQYITESVTSVNIALGSFTNIQKNCYAFLF